MIRKTWRPRHEARDACAHTQKLFRRCCFSSHSQILLLLLQLVKLSPKYFSVNSSKSLLMPRVSSNRKQTFIALQRSKCRKFPSHLAIVAVRNEFLYFLFSLYRKYEMTRTNWIWTAVPEPLPGSAEFESHNSMSTGGCSLVGGKFRLHLPGSSPASRKIYNFDNFCCSQSSPANASKAAIKTEIRSRRRNKFQRITSSWQSASGGKLPGRPNESKVFLARRFLSPFVFVLIQVSFFFFSSWWFSALEFPHVLGRRVRFVIQIDIRDESV